MARDLVVAYQTSASSELIHKLREIASADRGAEFVLLVPATPVKHLLTWEDGNTRDVAGKKARESAIILRLAGLEVVDAIVGSPNPARAVQEEYERRPGAYAQTIISTLPAGVSRWLRRDLANQIRKLGIDVIEVVARGSKASDGDSKVVASAAGTEGRGAASLDLRELAAWRKTELACLNGLLGPITEIVYDYATQQPVWLGVASHPLPFRTLLVPVNAVTITDRGLRANLTQEMILEQPPSSIGEGFASITEEEHLFDYFGLPFSELRDIRVLRAGDYPPGLERNEQAIFSR